MNEETQLRLQAYLDGELSSGEAREMAGWLERDAEARSLLAELENTRGALAGFDSEIKLPESREFYWSKIEREIRRSERPEQVSAPVSFLAGLRLFLVPAGALAALVLAGLFVWQQIGSNGAIRPPETETAFASSDTFTYRDYSRGMTFVWVSYPAENDFSEMDPGDILN